MLFDSVSVKGILTDDEILSPEIPAFPASLPGRNPGSETDVVALTDDQSNCVHTDQPTNRNKNIAAMIIR